MPAHEEYSRQILEKVNKLPLERVLETLDFVTFIEEQEGLRTQDGAIDASEDEFAALLTDCFGSWKGEVDGVTYSNRLRDTWRGRYGGSG